MLLSINKNIQIHNKIVVHQNITKADPKVLSEREKNNILRFMFVNKLFIYEKLLTETIINVH